MTISEDGSMLAFGAAQTAYSRGEDDVDTGEVHFVNLTTMTAIDQDSGTDGYQPVYLAGAIDPDDSGLDEIVVGPCELAFSQDGTRLFATGDNHVNTDVDATAMINVATGAVTFFENLGRDRGRALQLMPDGQLWLGTSSSVILLDQSSGAQTMVNDDVSGFVKLGASGAGTYYAKTESGGFRELSADGTELYDADGFCRSNKTSDTPCTNSVSNYGHGVVSSPY